MFKICELWTVILWYDLNPRVRCAFGNVLYFIAQTIQVCSISKKISMRQAIISGVDCKIISSADNTGQRAKHR